MADPNGIRLVVCLALMLGGLGVAYLARSAGGRGGTFFWWAGWAVAIVGLVMFVVKPLIYLEKVLREMFGV